MDRSNFTDSSPRGARAVLVTAALGLLAVDSYGQTPQFEWRHGGNAFGIAFFDEFQGVVTRDGGGALYTTDGASWLPATVPDAVRGQLRHVFVADAENGVAWAVGEGGVVLRTANRGVDWLWINDGQQGTNTPIVDKLGNKASLYDIYMWDAFAGIVAGEEGALARTEDGWQSWTQISLPSTVYDPTSTDRSINHPADLYRFAIDPSGDVFLAADYGRLLKSTDQGQSFALHHQFTHYCSNPAGELRDFEYWGLSFAGSFGVLAGGFGTNDGAMWTTGDGGATWTNVARVVPPDAATQAFALAHDCKLPTIYGAVAIASQVVVTVGYAGGVWSHEISDEPAITPCACTGTETTTAAKWVQHRPVIHTGSGLSPTRPPHSSVCALDEENVWWCGLNATIQFSDDLGETFVETSCQIPARIGAGAFLDDQLGLVVAQSHRIFRTTDGGATWTAVHQGADDTYGDYTLRYVAFSTAPSSALAVALGDRAILLRSTDQGATWAELNAPHAVNNSFALADGSDVFYVGSVNGVVWRTDLAQLDAFGALEWEMRSLPVTATNVTGLHFVDADTGYAVTDTMQLYETANGGAVWTQVGITGSPNTQVLKAVRTWGDGSKAIAVGENGMLLARVGAQFQQVNLASATGGRALLCVELVDGGTQAFVGGNDGLLLHFSGSSLSDVTDPAKWSTPKSQTSNPIVDMTFDAPDHGFVFAPAGVVVEYD